MMDGADPRVLRRLHQTRLVRCALRAAHVLEFGEALSGVASNRRGPTPGMCRGLVTHPRLVADRVATHRSLVPVHAVVATFAQQPR